MINPKDVKKLFDAGGQVAGEDATCLYLSLVEEEFWEMVAGYFSMDKVEILDGAIDLIWVTIGFLLPNGFTVDQIRDAWEEIALSNWSKIDPSTGTCIKNEAGKIMKPAGYFKPNLAKIVEA